MKTSKSALKSSIQGECGVWLDTAQLKGKAKQKRLARPISKLLNPFAGGEGYNVAVALNFTQTKLEMPKTKQSSISTFFTSQRRVLNKMSTSDVPKMDPVLPSSSTTSSTCALTAPTSGASGTKRRREIDLDQSKSEPSIDPELKNENVYKRAVWQEQEGSHSPPQNTFCEFKEEQVREINPPQSKRRLVATSSLPEDSQPLPLAWSQDPLFAYSQYSDSEFHLTDPKNTTANNFSNSDPSFFNSLQSEEAFGIRMDAEAITSTQKPYKHAHFSQVDVDKENSRCSSSKRPSHTQFERVSNFKWTEPKTASPRKHIPVHPWKKADKKHSHDSEFKRTKPSSSPLKKLAPQQSCTVTDEDSLAMLFTQDSEGFRVIAHRGLQARSPLKDQSNVSTGTLKSSDYSSLMEEDEEDEMLFTQDSQGNLVIKH